jgi:hypothetical protein
MLISCRIWQPQCRQTVNGGWCHQILEGQRATTWDIRTYLRVAQSYGNTGHLITGRFNLSAVKLSRRVSPAPRGCKEAYP